MQQGAMLLLLCLPCTLIPLRQPSQASLHRCRPCSLGSRTHTHTLTCQTCMCIQAGSLDTLAKLARGIAAGDIRRYCEERERTLQVGCFGSERACQDMPRHA